MVSAVPSSQDRLLRRVLVYDLLVALVAPLAAFFMRQPSLFVGQQAAATYLYVLAAFLTTVVVMMVFDFGRGLTRFAEARDLIEILRVSAVATGVTAIFVFTFQRLEDVPRSLPVIHLAVLALLLSLGRAVPTWRHARRHRARTTALHDPENVLVIGVNALSTFYFRMVDSFAGGRISVVGVLDDAKAFRGRAIAGRRVFGDTASLERLVAEFRVHGVNITKIIDTRDLVDAEADPLLSLCASSGLKYCFLRGELGIDAHFDDAATTPIAVVERFGHSYLGLKRLMDLAVGVPLLLASLPVIAIVGLALLLDIGWPIFFWQRRVGRGGMPFLIYKLRTFKKPFDRHGNPIAEDQRRSSVGVLLRRFRLDEILQVWNIITGEMSFIGPRPLLPEDQPPNSLHRLKVRPGITGWAQIHGGALVGAIEKGKLDDEYVDKLSLGLDVRILAGTLLIFFAGDRFRARRKRRPYVDPQSSGEPVDDIRRAAGVRLQR